MLRLLPARGLHELYRCSQFLSSHVTKRQLTTLSHHRTSTVILARSVSAGRPVWKDATEPKGDKNEEVETIDLDKWKSVMRSRAASEEIQQAEDDKDTSDDDDNDGDLTEPAGDLKGSSLLEATRELVVMWQQAGKFVPQEITDEQLQELSECTTKSSRRRYLKFLAIKERFKISHKKKQQQKREAKEAILEQKRKEPGYMEQPRNTFIIHFWSRSLDKLLSWRCAQAMLFDQPLVFDMSYDSHMSRRELENTVQQLMEVEAWNRRAIEPFHLHFCNLQPGGAYEKELVKRYSAESWDRLLITSTDRPHIDMFPQESLVYLTADSPNVLRTYDHSKVYIIGALVDRSARVGLSLANAKRLKLATARLPLDEHLQWEIGAKTLTLDQMIRIMLTLKETGKWEDALKFVPQRKHQGFLKEQTQNEVTVHNKVGGVANNRPGQDGDRLLKSGERNGERTFKNVDQRLYRASKEPRSTSRDSTAGLSSYTDNKHTVTRSRTSFKSKMEVKNSAGKSEMWWDHE